MALLSLALLATGVAGCKSALQTVGLLWEGTDIPPEYKEDLKGKKVAVVCKPLTSQEFSNSGEARALAEGICERLKVHIKEIIIVDPQKVSMLVDEKGMEDFGAIGKKLKADKVIGIDIESFGILDGPTLYRGRASLSVQVYDVAEKKVEWRKTPPAIEYPRIGSTPMADLPENEFRNNFVKIIAEQVARLFYAHDRHDDYGDDALTIH